MSQTNHISAANAGYAAVLDGPIQQLDDHLDYDGQDVPLDPQLYRPCGVRGRPHEPTEIGSPDIEPTTARATREKDPICPELLKAGRSAPRAADRLPPFNPRHGTEEATSPFIRPNVARQFRPVEPEPTTRRAPVQAKVPVLLRLHPGLADRAVYWRAEVRSSLSHCACTQAGCGLIPASIAMGRS